MTDQELLDMFACAAMQGMITKEWRYNVIIKTAYDFAEDMLAERKKRYGTKE